MAGGPSGTGNFHEDVGGLFHELVLTTSGAELEESECEVLAFEGPPPRCGPSCPPNVMAAPGGAGSRRLRDGERWRSGSGADGGAAAAGGAAAGASLPGSVSHLAGGATLAPPAVCDPAGAPDAAMAAAMAGPAAAPPIGGGLSVSSQRRCRRTRQLSAGSAGAAARGRSRMWAPMGGGPGRPHTLPHDDTFHRDGTPWVGHLPAAALFGARARGGLQCRGRGAQLAARSFACPLAACASAAGGGALCSFWSSSSSPSSVKSPSGTGIADAPASSNKTTAASRLMYCMVSRMDMSPHFAKWFG